MKFEQEKFIENRGQVNLDLERIKGFTAWFLCEGGYKLHFGREFTGIENHLGSSSVINSEMTKKQIAVAIYMTGNHELLKQIETHPEKINPKELSDKKILHGLKILDLGCGPEPTFARTARCLGADVYTVDVIPSADFACGIWQGKSKGYNRDCDFFPKELQDLEKQKHIQLDLRDKDSFKKILEITDGNFDLVTSAHLISDEYEYQGRIIHAPSLFEEDAMQLLKKGGVLQTEPFSGLEIKQ